MRERFAHLLDAGRVRAARPLCFALVAPLFALILAALGGFSSVAGDDQVYKVGGDVEAPRVIYKTEPAYTPEAKEAKIEGRVRLTCIVRTDRPIQLR